jgi:hypothetical protein
MNNSEFMDNIDKISQQCNKLETLADLSITSDDKTISGLALIITEIVLEIKRELQEMQQDS